MTRHLSDDDKYRLSGRCVRVINLSRPGRPWEGTVVGFADHPTVIIDTAEGRRVLPQWFDIEVLPDAAYESSGEIHRNTDGPMNCRPENVVKAEALRYFADQIDDGMVCTAKTLRARADELDPPKRPDEPTGVGAVADDSFGCRWVRCTDLDRDTYSWRTVNASERTSPRKWSELDGPMTVLRDGVSIDD